MNLSNKICCLCLENNEKLLEIYGKQGIDLNVGSILQEHFWFEVSTFAAKNICENCWKKVESFHIFYNFVKSIHQQQTSETKTTIDNRLVCSFKEEPIDIKDVFTDFAGTTDSPAPQRDELKVHSNTAKIPARVLHRKREILAASDAIDSPASTTDKLHLGNYTAKGPATVVCKTRNSKFTIFVSCDYKDSPAPISDKVKVGSCTTKGPAVAHKTSNFKRKVLAYSETTGFFAPQCDEMKLHSNTAEDPVTLAHRTRNCYRTVLTSDTIHSPAPKTDVSEVNSGTSKGPVIVARKKRKYTRKTSPPLFRFKSDAHTSLISQYFNMACDLCDTSFSSYRDAKEHYKVVHDIKKGYLICCKKKYYRLNLMVSHCEWHINPDSLKCHQCSTSYPDKYKLQKHMVFMHTGRNEKLINCNDCNQKFPRLQELLSHQRKQHRLLFKCPVCQKCFTGNIILRHHIRDQHSPDLEREFRSKMKSLTTVDQEKEKAKQFQCDICDRRFLHLSYLKNHINRVHVHRGDRSFICEICAKPLQTAQAYKFHYISVHTNELKKFKCDICGKWFKGKPAISRHLRRHNSKAATCIVCGHVSSTAYGLRSHILRVHREASLECTVCGKKFKDKYLLKEHMAMHAGITDLYYCEFCTKTFRSNANMYAHRKRTHPAELEEMRRQKEILNGA